MPYKATIRLAVECDLFDTLTGEEVSEVFSCIHPRDYVLSLLKMEKFKSVTVKEWSKVYEKTENSTTEVSKNLKKD